MDYTTNTRMSGLLDELERENARLTRENGILTARNAAQSDMLRDAVKASAEWQNERAALHKAIANALVGAETMTMAQASVRLMELRRAYADLCQEVSTRA